MLQLKLGLHLLLFLMGENDWHVDQLPSFYCSLLAAANYKHKDELSGSSFKVWRFVQDKPQEDGMLISPVQ